MLSIAKGKSEPAIGSAVALVNLVLATTTGAFRFAAKVAAAGVAVPLSLAKPAAFACFARDNGTTIPAVTADVPVTAAATAFDSARNLAAAACCLSARKMLQPAWCLERQHQEETRIADG